MAIWGDEVRPGDLIKALVRINCYGLKELEKNDIVLVLTNKKSAIKGYPWFITVLHGECILGIDIAAYDTEFEMVSQ